MNVFNDLVGQSRVAGELSATARAAAGGLAGGAGAGMTHAWLFTGPPGSGRSVAARAFAAALQCEAVGGAVGADAGTSGVAGSAGAAGTVSGGGPEPGCGECAACRAVLGGTHPDVEVVTPEGLSIGVKQARALVARSAMAPLGARWQVLLVEDADRLTEGAANVLLKALEEPAARTVWLLCVPSPADLVVTVRSRCRVVSLATPSADAVAQVLVSRDGVEPAVAAVAARAAFGHVGRARRLATDELARERRREALRLTALRGVGECLTAAARLVDSAGEDAAAVTTDLNEAEAASLRQAYGDGVTTTGGSKATRAAARQQTAALRELEAQQKSRATRAQRDALDRALTDVAAFYRDVLAVQFRANVNLANVDAADAVRVAADATSPESTLRRIDAVLACRERLEANANPLLAVEAMTLALRGGP